MRVVVKSVSVEPNIRGLRMRRVHLSAIAGDEFVSDDPLPENVTDPGPDGSISLLLSASAAKRFAVGDEFDLAFHERE
jgi:hypothetical protein